MFELLFFKPENDREAHGEKKLSWNSLTVPFSSAVEPCSILTQLRLQPVKMAAPAPASQDGGSGSSQSRWQLRLQPVKMATPAPASQDGGSGQL